MPSNASCFVLSSTYEDVCKLIKSEGNITKHDRLKGNAFAAIKGATKTPAPVRSMTQDNTNPPIAGKPKLAASSLDQQLLAAMQAKRAEILGENAARREEWASARRQADREEYAAKQARKGKVVRPYRRHHHEVPDHLESYDQRSARMHRDRMRDRRGVDAASVRSYHDLSGLTAEEKLEWKRKQNREAKQRGRLRKECSKLLDDLELDLENDESIMFLE